MKRMTRTVPRLITLCQAVFVNLYAEKYGLKLLGNEEEITTMKIAIRWLCVLKKQMT